MEGRQRCSWKIETDDGDRAEGFADTVFMFSIDYDQDGSGAHIRMHATKADGSSADVHDLAALWMYVTQIAGDNADDIDPSVKEYVRSIAAKMQGKEKDGQQA